MSWTPHADAPAIWCEHLTKRYRRGLRGRLTAVERLSLQVPQGSTFGLLGPNGAGKTTAIMMLLGLVRPDEGEAKLFGESPRSVAARERLGFVPERFQLPSALRADEFLAAHTRLLGLGSATARTRVGEVLETVGLADRSRDRIKGFSKGMQQRLAIAQALLGKPPLLVLDEPTSALDPLGRREVRDLIREVARGGTTVLLNSHILSEVETVCDSVAILREGRLLHQGPARSETETMRVDVRVGGWSTVVLAALDPVAARVTVGEIDPRSGLIDITCELRQAHEVPHVAAAIHEAGAQLHSLVPRGESLEELFVRLVGAPDDEGETP